MPIGYDDVKKILRFFQGENFKKLFFMQNFATAKTSVLQM